MIQANPVTEINKPRYGFTIVDNRKPTTLQGNENHTTATNRAIREAHLRSLNAIQKIDPGSRR